MTNIKKLFLSLSLIAAQSTFCMDVLQPIQSPAGKTGWVKVRTLDDFKPFIGKFFKHRLSISRIELLYSHPDTDLSCPFMIRDNSVFSQLKIGVDAYDLEQGKGPLVRLLTLEELRDLHTKIKSKILFTTDYSGKSILPNEGKDFFRASHLTPDERARYLKQPLQVLLGIRRFRKSSLSILPKDVVIYAGKLARADDPILKFE